ncbi:HMA2 domain-containing protein [Aliinostoc sp. HNIBRCY26]|uniref:HMA2 domain-containing protein n=1 Tax=Aliinostoc sp. HNIBRCY26 TaxID=3418997 RepID=UPI003D08FC83
MLTNSHGNLTTMPAVENRSNCNQSSTPISTKIISDTPGRLRLRIGHAHRQADTMQHIADTLKSKSNVQDVKTNLQHGSIVIKHDATDSSWEDVLATLEDLGVIFGEIGEGNTEAATTVASAVVDLNKRVKQATDGAVDIRFLFPLGLSILAVRQLIIKGLQLEIIPWYVLAWYSFDSFIKLHGITPPKSSQE